MPDNHATGSRAASSHNAADARPAIEDALRGHVADLELDLCVDRVLLAVTPATPDRRGRSATSSRDAVEEMARALCVADGRDPDWMVAPHEHSTTRWEPFPTWEHYQSQAALVVCALIKARRSTETPQEGERAEMNDFRTGYEFGYGDGQVGEYQPEKYLAAAEPPTTLGLSGDE